MWQSMKKIMPWLVIVVLLITVMAIRYAEARQEGQPSGGGEQRIQPQPEPPGKGTGINKPFPERRGDNRDDTRSGKIDRPGDGNSGQGDDKNRPSKDKFTPPSNKEGKRPPVFKPHCPTCRCHLLHRPQPSTQPQREEDSGKIQPSSSSSSPKGDNQGVRDRGQGEGRDGVGQGKGQGAEKRDKQEFDKRKLGDKKQDGKKERKEDIKKEPRPAHNIKTCPICNPKGAKDRIENRKERQEAIRDRVKNIKEKKEDIRKERREDIRDTRKEDAKDKTDKDKDNQGVRDRGKGEGRDSAGQGKGQGDTNKEEKQKE